MALSPEIMKVIACPQCRGLLNYAREGVLVCVRCRICFPVENDIPRLSAESAMPLSPDGKIIPRETTAFFSIESGVDAGTNFRLETGTCKAVGRRLTDAVQTQVFNVDFTMTLDDHTRKMIMNYLSKTTGKKKSVKKDKPSELGAFRRTSDLVLNDPSVSRLHAMIFHDETGVGILDLVSRNGTTVNGREVETCLLKSGDEIKLGETLLRFTFR